ncbi:MAG TPA: bifunctional DNA primase/polymerase [Trebonia sp.]
MPDPVIVARRSPAKTRAPGPLEQLRAGRLARRLPQLYAGLVLYGFTLACLIRAHLGNAPWDVLHQGVAGHLGVSIGAVTIAVSLVVLLAWIPLREMPGLGTVSNALIVGLATNLGLSVLPAPHPLAARIALAAAGILGNAVATAMYIGARLGPGPRDGLMTGLHRRTGWPIWLVRTSLEASVVVLGWLLGGVFGVATLLYAVAIGPLVQRLLPLFTVGVDAASGVPARRLRSCVRGNNNCVSVADVTRADPALLSSALAAAQRGWYVFPCAVGAKRPALRGNWQDLATTSPDQIRDWWARARYNIGIACGPSRLVVIDLDLPHDAEDDDGALFPLSGADILSRLARQHGERYPGGTYIVDTPSGGCHLYFCAAGQTPVRNSAGVVGPHIDVRADGGYIVGSGSRIGGRAYTARGPRAAAPLPSWLARLIRDSYEPPTVPLPRLPLGDRAQGRAYAMAALRAETERVAAARPGTRNHTLNRAAFSLGQLVAARLIPPIPVITALIDAARYAGLPEDEAVRTVRSGLAAGARKPRAEPR